MIKKAIAPFKKFFSGNNDTPLSVHFSGITRFAPLIVVGGFFLCTVLAFAFGPLEWNIQNPVKLYSFLIACTVAMIGGYCLAIFKGKTPQKKLNINIDHMLLLGAVVFLVLYIPTVYITTGKFYPDIYTGITDTGLAYRLNKYYNETASPLILYVRMLASPLMIFVTPITIYFMPKLSLRGKILGISVITLTTFLGIAQGINKSVADLTAQLVLALLILLLAGNGKKKNPSYRIKLLAIILVVCLLFFLYYANSMTNRVTSDIQNPTTESEGEEEPPHSKPKDPLHTVDQEELDEAIQSNAQFAVGTQKENYFLNKILPPRIMSIASYLCSYLTHGYHGLSLALDEEFTCTYGLGFSDFFRHNFLKLVGKGDTEAAVKAQTYYGKISAKGWPVGLFWSSFFVYPASDITFPGTVLLVFLIGFLFGLSWKDSIITQNPFAIASFFGFSTMIFYFSANNQMFQGGENFIGFLAMLALWLVSRIYLKRKS